MAYFENNGRMLGGAGPRAGANGVGEYFSTSGAGGNSIGEYFAAMNGMGQVAQPLSPALPSGSRPFQDGILGARRQDLVPFGSRLRPFQDGMLGPGLGAEVGPSPDLNLSDPAVIDELKMILNILPTSGYTFVQNGWGQKESDGYVAVVKADVTFDKSDFSVVFNGLTYPTARGADSLMGAAIQEWITETGDYDAATLRVSQLYPTLGTWFYAYKAANFTGDTIAPTGAPQGPARASMFAVVGVGALAVGLGFVMFGKKKKPMRSNPRRRRRTRRRR